jgi:hypothetical protein
MLNVIMMTVFMLNVIMMNVIMMNVIMLNVIMMNVIMLNVIMLSVVAPQLSQLFLPCRFSQSRPLAQSGVLDVVEVLVQRITRSGKDRFELRVMEEDGERQREREREREKCQELERK